MPFPLIPLIISAITGAAAIAGRVRPPRGRSGFLARTPVAPPGIAIPPIIGRIGGVISDIGGAIAGGAAAGFLMRDPAAGQAGCPPQVFLDACGNRVDVEGCPIKKRRRRRGITATELRGFKKLNRLLDSIGKVPAKPRRRPC